MAELCGEHGALDNKCKPLLAVYLRHHLAVPAASLAPSRGSGREGLFPLLRRRHTSIDACVKVGTYPHGGSHGWGRGSGATARGTDRGLPACAGCGRPRSASRTEGGCARHHVSAPRVFACAQTLGRAGGDRACRPGASAAARTAGMPAGSARCTQRDWRAPRSRDAARHPRHCPGIPWVHLTH